MSGEQIIDAIGGIEDKYIAEAAPGRRRTRRREAVKWISAAACIVLVVSVLGGVLLGRGLFGNAHTAILESGETVRFEKNPDPERNRADMAVYTRELSEEELRALFGDLPVTVKAVYGAYSRNLFGYTGKIGDCLLYIETESVSLDDTVIRGFERASEVEGVSVYAGYFLTDANSKGERTIIYYARFTLGGVRYYLEQSGPHKDSESVRQSVAEKARDLITAFQAGKLFPNGTWLPVPEETNRPSGDGPGMDSPDTGEFTKKEKLANHAYHVLFPDRTDYISYRAEKTALNAGQLFWGPEGMESQSLQYTLYSSCRYEVFEFDDMYAFVYVEAQWSSYETEMYVAFIRPDGTLASVLTDCGGNHYKYRMFTLNNGFYLAAETAYVYQGYGYWNSFIVDLREEKIVWQESEWYGNYDGRGQNGKGMDQHKLLISSEGFTVYEAELMEPGHIMKYKETGFLSYAELLSFDGLSDRRYLSLINNAFSLFAAVYQDASDYVDPDGEPVWLMRNGRMVQYLPAKGEYAAYSYWENWAKSIYTEDLAPYAIELGKGTGQTLGLLVNYKGKAYFLKDTPAKYDDDLPNTGAYANFKHSVVVKEPGQETTEGDFSYCWISSRDEGKAEGGFAVNHMPLFHGIYDPLFLTVTVVNTENGWRIQKGTAADLFCQNHVSERSGTIYLYGENNFQFRAHQFLYRQVAEQAVSEFLKQAFGPETEARILQIMGCDAYTNITFDYTSGWFAMGDVIVSSDTINGGKPFALSLVAEMNTENWKVNLDSSIQRYDVFWRYIEEYDVDETPMIAIYK